MWTRAVSEEGIEDGPEVKDGEANVDAPGSFSRQVCSKVKAWSGLNGTAKRTD